MSGLFVSVVSFSAWSRSRHAKRSQGTREVASLKQGRVSEPEYVSHRKNAKSEGPQERSEVGHP
jgi:hypothetical protein